MGGTTGGAVEARWERDERVLWRRGPGWVVLLCSGSEAPISVRGAGVALWAALDRPRSLAELARHLAAEFAADSAIVRRDIEPVVATLAASGAVRRVS
jgi:hypothetical protein